MTTNPRRLLTHEALLALLLVAEIGYFAATGSNFLTGGNAFEIVRASVEIGLLAESTATQPGALERNYVPRSNKILLASRLLQPRESQKLGFNAIVTVRGEGYRLSAA